MEAAMTSSAAVYASTRTRGRGLPVRLRRHMPLVIVYGVLLVMFVFTAVMAERFLTTRNLFNVLRTATFLGTVAVGQTLVILTAGIDLSVGSLVKLSVLVGAILMAGESQNTLVGVGAVLLIGAGVGLVHALLINEVRVAPFIVTLGSYSILRGVSLAITSKPVGRASPEVLGLYDLRVGPVPLLVLLFALLLVLAILMLRRTRFGRHIYAVGGSEEVAHLSGVAVKRVRYGVYMLCSMCAALTGLLYLSRMGVGDPVVGDGLELQSITAVILGGTSLFGGRGGLVGTLGGVLLLTLTNNMLVMLNVNQWIQQLIEGLIIVAAVALYNQKGRR
jgi:ribose/xylose/arabinose/galactoside ABC-type transport system permease subunit